MDEQNGHCPFANAGGDTLDRAVPHISGGEDTGDTGLQEERIAVKFLHIQGTFAVRGGLCGVPSGGSR